MKKRSSIAALFLFLLIIPLITASTLRASPNPPPQGTVQEQIDELLDAYQQALDEELLTGETEYIMDPVDGSILVLAGESAARMDRLWQETVERLNALVARPPAERQEAVRMIRSIEPGAVAYLDQVTLPYNLNAELERYQTDRHIYSVDIATNQIVEILLIDDRDYSVESVFTVEELELKARALISQVAGDIDLERMNPEFGDKLGENFFFRWVDPARTLEGGVSAFVQVGYSRGGDFLNYVNTLPLAQNGSAGIESIFSQVYANGGNYWQWLYGSKNTQSNAGYCYIYGWCSPKNFYWWYTCFGCKSSEGRWLPNPNGWVYAYAFIPSTHATTLMACYDSWYNGGSSYHGRCINQSIYYNSWVSITYYSLYNIRRIHLSNICDGATTREIAWDETWVYGYTQ